MISIVMPVMEQVDFTRECLQSLRSNTIVPSEIIILDNGNGSSKCLVEEFRDLNILYIDNPTNIGVNSSWNLGVVYSTKPYIMFLNNDTVLNKFFIQKVLYVMQNIPTAGICIPIREHTKPRVELINKDDMPITVDAEYIEGWAFTIRKSLLDMIGPIPESFKTYMGDTLFFEGSKILGYKNLQMTNCTVFHHGSLTANAIYGTTVHEKHRYENTMWRQTKDIILDEIKIKNLK